MIRRIAYSAAGVLIMLGFVLFASAWLKDEKRSETKEGSAIIENSRAVDLRAAAAGILPLQVLEKGKSKLSLTIFLPTGYELTEGSPLNIEWESENEGSVKILKSPTQIDFAKTKFPLEIPVQAGAGSTNLNIKADIYYCRVVKTGMCFFQEVQLAVPVEVKEQGASQIDVPIKIKPKA